MIKNAIIINADKVWDTPQDILCMEGKITQIAKGIASGNHEIIDATGNATAPHFLDSSGTWGPETDADYAGLERILANAHVIASSPPMSELYTNALLPAG